MIKLVCTLAAAVVVFPTWKYLSLKSENTDHQEENSLFLPSRMEEPKIILTMEQNEENLTEKLKPEVKKNNMKLNLKDKLPFGQTFTAVCGSIPIHTVFMLLLINTCGADLVASVSSVSDRLSSLDVLFDMALSVFIALVAVYKWKSEKAELEKKNTHLQRDSASNKEDREDVVSTLMEVKTELENQRAGLKQLLEEVEREREANKQKLQKVEKEITEVTFDQREELLKEKENLLRDQWKLDETKRSSERQILNTEKLLEPVDMQVTRIHRGRNEGQSEE